MQKSSSRSTVVEVERDVGSAGFVEIAVSGATEAPSRDLLMGTTFVAVAGAVSGEVAVAAAVPKDFVAMSVAL